MCKSSHLHNSHKVHLLVEWMVTSLACFIIHWWWDIFRDGKLANGADRVRALINRSPTWLIDSSILYPTQDGFGLVVGSGQIRSGFLLMKLLFIIKVLKNHIVCSIEIEFVTWGTPCTTFYHCTHLALHGLFPRKKKLAFPWKNLLTWFCTKSLHNNILINIIGKGRVMPPKFKPALNQTLVKAKKIKK